MAKDPDEEGQQRALSVLQNRLEKRNPEKPNSDYSFAPRSTGPCTFVTSRDRRSCDTWVQSLDWGQCAGIRQAGHHQEFRSSLCRVLLRRANWGSFDWH